MSRVYSVAGAVCFGVSALAFALALRHALAAGRRK